ncbi:MAG: lamin tail domain-containing protein [Fibrobacteria bacterium]|nr:lamin tail domain-containing protein [Fibrobacteria bacterium]
MAIASIVLPLLFGMRISEVLADPVRVDDARGEFIEVQATQEQEDPSGWRLVVSGRDTLTLRGAPMGKGRFLVAGKAVASENGGFDVDILQASGWGIPNAGGSLLLLDPGGRRIDSMDWSDAPSGSSLERCTDGSWRASERIFGWGDAGTPGEINSCDDSPLRQEWKVERLERIGDSLVGSIRNVGIEGWSGIPARWMRNDIPVDSTRVSCAPGVATRIAIGIEGRVGSRSRWVLRLPPDMRPQDDSLGVWIGDSSAGVRICEIQPGGTGPEWVELRQIDPTPLLLQGWTLGDASLRGKVPAGVVLAGGGRIVLSQDCQALRAASRNSAFACSEIAPWARLSASSDAISLRDADGNLWDSVHWEGSTRGWTGDFTRERTAWDGPADVDVWVPSDVPGGSPGTPAAPSVGWTDFTGESHSLQVVRRRMRLGDAGNTIKMVVRSPSREEWRIDVFDMGRRRIARIHQGASPRNGELEWDGSDGQGREVRPGVYLLLVECGPVKNPRWRTREWIVVSPHP